MPPDPVQTVTLACHPATPTDAVRSIGARVRREAHGELSVTYVVEGELERLRVPEPRAPRFTSGLWRHACCEIFIACQGMPAYYEFNLSPSGEWAAYAFDGYRAPLVLALSAVIEDREGALSYWALRHPRGRPDFHHPEAFALDLARAIA